MTGEELRQLIKRSGMSLTDVAKELDTSPQNLNARLNRRSVKYDFVSAVKSILDKCCPPLPVEIDNSVMSHVNAGGNVQQTYSGGDAALLAENAVLRQQNEYLLKLLSECMAKIPNNNAAS